MVKFEIYKAQDYLWHWRIKAVNGEIVSWSEGYSSLQGARNSVAWMRRNAFAALVSEI